MRGLPASGTVSDSNIEQVHEPTRALGETSGMHIHLHVPWGSHLRVSGYFAFSRTCTCDVMQMAYAAELR